MSKLPQRLVNVRVRDRGALAQAREVDAAVRAAERELDGRGRVLVRPSGTEPLVRVMVEAPSDEEAEDGVRPPGRARRARARLARARREQPSGRELRRAGGASASLVSSIAMCGIVGYVGRRPARELLLAGLSGSSTAAMTPPGSR